MGIVGRSPLNDNPDLAGELILALAILPVDLLVSAPDPVRFRAFFAAYPAPSPTPRAAAWGPSLEAALVAAGNAFLAVLVELDPTNFSVPLIALVAIEEDLGVANAVDFGPVSCAGDLIKGGSPAIPLSSFKTSSESSFLDWSSERASIIIDSGLSSWIIVYSNSDEREGIESLKW